MQRRRRWRARILIAVLLSGLAWEGWRTTDAQWASLVYDPNNYAINLLTQANTLRSTINEATMIANQVKALTYQLQSLVNEAQNLKVSPLRLLGQIEGLWSSYNALMDTAEGLTYNLDHARVNFETRYPSVANADIGTITQRSADMLQSIRAASKTAVSTQSVYDRLGQELAANRQAITAAQAARGAMEIAQASAQIQALTNEQLMTMTEIEAANGRVQTEFVAMQVKERQDGAAVADQFMAGYGTHGFKGIGESAGVPLR